MDKQELVDQITSQVLARMKGATALSPAGGAWQQTPPSAASSGGGVGTAVAEPPARPAGSAGGGSTAAGTAGAAAPTAAKPGVPHAELAKYIDHTLLKPDATREQFDKLCAEAVEYGFYSVCINAAWTAYCARKLRGTPVKVCT
ncbi:MAG: hypothetical protein JW820_10775, partial [Spirochaetales bacterium]|nr:hypothetical protein [Spirochaetales bacterium]